LSLALLVSNISRDMNFYCGICSAHFAPSQNIHSLSTLFLRFLSSYKYHAVRTASAIYTDRSTILQYRHTLYYSPIEFFKSLHTHLLSVNHNQRPLILRKPDISKSYRNGIFHRYRHPDRKSTRLNSSHVSISYA